MVTPDQTTGEIIQRQRVRLGLTQQELTDKLNDVLPSHAIIERTTISRWEKDKHHPRSHHKVALETVLKVKIGDPPPRTVSSARYYNNQGYIEKVLLDRLQGCKELWITSGTMRHGIWQSMPQLNRYLERLRRSDTCSVKELLYLHKFEDIKQVRALAESRYPRYRISLRIATGYPMPMLFMPQEGLSVLLSGFGDDVRIVALELTGQNAFFVEHYFRYRWMHATPLLDDDGVVHHDKLKVIALRMKEVGGVAENHFDIR